MVPSHGPSNWAMNEMVYTYNKYTLKREIHNADHVEATQEENVFMKQVLKLKMFKLAGRMTIHENVWSLAISCECVGYNVDNSTSILLRAVISFVYLLQKTLVNVY